METPWDNPIRNVNGAWLTKPDSWVQSTAGHNRPNRRKILLKSGFLATLSFMLHLKSRIQPTRATHPARRLVGEHCLNPNDDDVMINDAGKQLVKTSPNWLPAGPPQGGHEGSAGAGRNWTVSRSMAAWSAFAV